MDYWWFPNTVFMISLGIYGWTSYRSSLHLCFDSHLFDNHSCPNKIPASTHYESRSFMIILVRSLRVPNVGLTRNHLVSWMYGSARSVKCGLIRLASGWSLGVYVSCIFYIVACDIRRSIASGKAIFVMLFRFIWIHGFIIKMVLSCRNDSLCILDLSFSNCSLTKIDHTLYLVQLNGGIWWNLWLNRGIWWNFSLNCGIWCIRNKSWLLYAINMNIQCNPYKWGLGTANILIPPVPDYLVIFSSKIIRNRLA